MSEEGPPGFRSGFVAVVGRPNVGKSTLVNAMVGSKVTITSSRPNTTRFQVRGVRHGAASQIVFVDTPGLHKPRTALGHRLNEAATASIEDVDVVVAMVEATGAIGPGDRRVLEAVLGRTRFDDEGRPAGTVPVLVVVNKTDAAGRETTLARLAQVAEEVGGLPGGAEAEFFPVSARKGQGVDALVAAIEAHLPEGPPYYPVEMASDMSESQWVADLVREQLLERLSDELPHSVACVITEWEWPRVRCEILVERESQKGIVIGHRGETLKAVGSAVRAQMDPGAFLELHVRVEQRWQQRDDALDRLGL